jgi:hypothetical protein
LFYLDLRRVKNASAIHAIVDGGNRACVSVSYGVEKERCETYAGHKVSVITQASLKEISLVRRGVVQHSRALRGQELGALRRCRFLIPPKAACLFGEWGLQSGAMTLAPLRDRNSVESFVVRSCDEPYNAFAHHQITRLA